MEQVKFRKYSTIINHHYNNRNSPQVDQHCSVDKFAIEHEGTVQYDQSLPKLDQFTICNWMRFTNHSGDHVMFTYAGNFNHWVFGHKFLTKHEILRKTCTILT